MIGDKYGEGEVANISVASQTLSLQTEGAELTGLGESWKVCAFLQGSPTCCTFPIRREPVSVARKDSVPPFSASAKHAAV